MKRASLLFLQTAIVLLGIVAVAALVIFPTMEGRAKNLSIFEIYSDPFILFAYAASIAFFVALYHVFKWLGYVGQQRFFSAESVSALTKIKNCGLVLSAFVALGGLYVLLFHHPKDDPAGFMTLSAVGIFLCLTVVAAATVIRGIAKSGETSPTVPLQPSIKI